ncbi:MAG: biotin/lipoyl-binding protein [Paludibacteraceae bacterium]|nr:biotin/lipoyl-binding protein [Paludibacteraceae bacterium]
MKKGFNFTIGGQKYETTVKEIEPNVAEVIVNGTSFIVEFQKNESKKVKAARVAAPTAAPTAAPVAAKPAGAATVKSPLPGSIVKVMVKPGDSVKKGDTLLTMESMKMENVVASEYTGIVKNVLVQPGQNVMQDDKLVEIETVAVAAAPAAPKPAPVAPKAAPAPQPAPAPAPATAPVGGNKVNSPLPGSVISVAVKEGQAVKKGDTLLVLESMKMENPIMADCYGTVTKIAVAPGQSVMQDDLLVVIA